MNRSVLIALRVALVVLLLVALLYQVQMPIMASDVARTAPEVEHLVVPYSVAAILAILCAEVAGAAVWRLLSLVERGEVFGDAAVRWVDVVIASAVGVSALSAAVLVHVLAVLRTGGPGVVLLLAVCVAGGAALALLMGVMRRLLRTAIDDRAELDEVI
ncbi:DUF2975 domain-containing protein [Sanguibacter suaedae]|uniref:DUF2975 domain-containing protein n=1 Tax=Sanguibacter suaedae TaxID=2795737 RepID=A0A934IB53_9MICO|nr:DUF2975 domain-containing protein [Sanguibacter suaedae]MBI9114651.1 DUF2975 domain-containing protein [Sanguibacter suaedae]